MLTAFKPTTLADVIKFMATCSDSDMRQIAMAWKYTNKSRTQQLKFSYRPGDKVSFKDKLGFTLEGLVVKRGRSLVHVRTTSGATWRVSPSLLTKVS